MIILGACALSSCDQLSTKGSLEPLDFGGLVAVQESQDKSFILTWKAPQFVQVESYEIYILDLAQDPEEVAESQSVAKEPDILRDGDVSKPLPLGPDTPEAKGRLLTLVSADETSFKTPSLDEGSYAFQVKVLSTDGRRDSNLNARWIRVSALDRFKGLQLAEARGSSVLLKWMPYPYLQEGEDYQYVVYKGLAFNEPVAVTKNTELLYSLAKEEEGSTLSFGVRFRDASGREDRNKMTIPIIVPAIDQDYVGCLSARGVGSDRIEVSFEWPSEKFEAIRILRDQKEAFYTLDRSHTSFIDRGLQEGETYRYTCQGIAGRETLNGTNIISANTLSTNAPTFQGISKVFLENPTVAVVSWGVTTGVPGQKFQVFGNPGSAVAWTRPPLLETEANVLSARIENLGDDLHYAFGVRACGLGACDNNIQQIAVTTGDAGPPKTPGASSVVMVNGKAVLTAPWEPSHGGMTKRKIYVKEGGDASQDITRYSLRNTIVVNDPTNPPRTLEFADVQNGRTYHFIVRDEDKHGRTNTSTTVATIDAGDLVPPDFSGLSSVAVGENGKEDTSVTLRFNAIASQMVDPNGAKTYRIYLREGGAAACTEEYFLTAIDATLYPQGASSYVLGNLKPSTLYGFCLKAADKSGNISTNSTTSTRRTLDLTPPVFDGIQSLTYNKQTGKMRVTWNTSTSADILEYKIETWHTAAGQTSATPLTLSAKHSDYPSEFSFDSGIVPFGSESKVEVVVNACDNGASITDGRQNCTSRTRNQAFSITLEDIQPPAGFIGIAAASELSTPVEGSIVVKWNAPPSWNDYAGFRVYAVSMEGNLTLLKDCQCLQNPNCSDQRTTCTIDGLDHYRTYNLHVRAYDANQNLTILDPLTASTRRRTLDATPPTFASNLSLSFAEGAVTLSWAAATDNQYAAEEGAKIRYRLYRKTGSNFANLINPAGDGTLLTEQDTREFVNSQNLTSGTYYYYTVCAVDSSNNQSCDGTFKSLLTPDLIPPTITNFLSNKTTASKVWNLSWTMADNTTIGSNLVVRIRELVSTDANAQADETSRSIFTQTGASSAVSLTGPLNTDTFVHYLLTVTDEAGNKAEARLRVFSTNRIVVESVKSSEGPTTGQKLIIVKGQGFHSTTRIEIGGTVCTNTQILSSRHVLCYSPAKAAGTYALVASNEDGSSATLNSAYTYCVPGSTCTQICNNPETWETNFARLANRGGSESAPIVICTGTHLNNLRSQLHGRFFQLGDNIDLSSFTSNSFVPLSTSNSGGFQGGFDGNGHIVANYRYSVPTADNVGLFRRIYGNSRVRNLAVVNFEITGRDYVGALAAGSDTDANTVIDEILATGIVTGRNVVGLALGHGHTITNNIAAIGQVTGSVHVGGAIGWKRLNGSNLSFEGTVNAVVGGWECNTGGVIGWWEGNAGTAFNLSSKATVNCLRATGYTGNTHRVGGLIGRLDNHTIKDATFEGTITSDREIGGAVGLLYNAARLDNVTTTATISGGHRIGGLVGTAYTNLPSVINSTTAATITSNASYVGGAIGSIHGNDANNLSIVSNVKSSGTVTTTSDTAGGLIGRVEYVTLTASSSTSRVTSRENTGGLIGLALISTIDTCFASGAVSAVGFNQVGGLIGNMANHGSGVTVQNSFALGTVEGQSHVGGLIGYCRGTIRNSYARGSVSAISVSGGFCGRNHDLDSGGNSLIENSYASGDVTLSGNDHAGGFIGHIYRRMTIRQSYATGRVSAPNNTGGFVGSIDMGPILVERSYATGSVSGNARVGGFLGYAYRYDATIDLKNNYARGDVRANSDAGGFAGLAAAIVTYSYATGRVQMDQTEANLGGFMGRLLSGGTNSTPFTFWDADSSGRTSSASGISRTGNQMRDPATFVDFDTTSIWKIDPNQYPTLR